MSDDDFMQASDEEEYDFEYEDDDDNADDAIVDIENKYYNAKQLKLTDPEDAIDEFLGVPALEKEKGEWGFKGLKQAIKLEFKLKRYDKVRREGRDGPPTAADVPPGERALWGAPRLRQIGRNPQLLGKIDQQHARLH